MDVFVDCAGIARTRSVLLSDQESYASAEGCLRFVPTILCSLFEREEFSASIQLNFPNSLDYEVWTNRGAHPPRYQFSNSVLL